MVKINIKGLPWRVDHNKMAHASYIIDNKGKVITIINTEQTGGIVADFIVQEVNKQLPMKPVKGHWEPALCPTCDNELSEHKGDGYYHHYTHLTTCNECGQKLNWEG